MQQQTPEWFSPDYPKLKLSENIGQAAIQNQLIEYPKVVRGMVDPPVLNQTHGLLSFMLLDKPTVNPKTGKPTFGFVKLRGNHPASEWESASKNIITNFDSKYRILTAPVGQWVPITDDDMVIKERIDVKISENDATIYDDATKRKKEEDERKMREIREREEELQKEGDIYDHPESLKYYTMKRVTELKLMESRDEYVKHIKNIEEKLEIVRKELYKLTLSNPQHRDNWVECYSEERMKAGVPKYVPSEAYLEEHDSTQSKIAESGVDLDDIKLPVTEKPKPTPVPTTAAEQPTENTETISLVMKQTSVGKGFATFCVETSRTAVDAILLAKKSLEKLSSETGMNKMLVAGALEMSGGNMDVALELLTRK